MNNDVLTIIYSFSDECTKSILTIAYPNLFNNLANPVVLAAKFNHLNLLKWLTNHNYKFKQDVTYYAALNNNLPMLKYARISGCAWNIIMVKIAIIKGYLDILVWIRQIGSFPKYNDICVLAAQYGHLDIIVWAKSVKYRCNSFVCSTAAEFGHYHIVKWYIDNMADIGHRWNPYVYSSAIKNGNLEIIGLLEEYGLHHYRDGYDY